ncbi:MAG TPA: RNA methyltransferase [Ilumatobacter sp.]|nr:RNA methyltransferase [Ilumatobacter sp.]
MLLDIDDPADPRLAPFRLHERGLANRAAKRDDTGAGLFLAEGDLVVERALDAGCVPVLALADGARLPSVAGRLATQIDVFVGGEAMRRHVTGLGMPQPVIALFQRPPRPTPAELTSRAQRLVVVEGVDNPANIGGIVRNAAGLGWDGLLLDHTSADPLHRRSLRVAMGTAFALPHARTRDLVGVLAGLVGIELFALTPDTAAVDIRDIRPGGRRAVLIGSERAGLSDAVLATATPVRIAMSPGVDSLNAAAATAIACFALA